MVNLIESILESKNQKKDSELIVPVAKLVV